MAIKVWVDRAVNYGAFPTDTQGASSWWLMQMVSRFGHFRAEASAFIDFSFTIGATRTIRIGVSYDFVRHIMHWRHAPLSAVIG